MSAPELVAQLRASLNDGMPLPGAGQTALRHQRLLDIARHDLSLARLAEAHWDAVAILREAGRTPKPDAIYGVWASEIPGANLTLSPDHRLCGTKAFCSGAQLVDRALVTVGAPEPTLYEVDLRQNAAFVCYDGSSWKTSAFADTHTATVSFRSLPLSAADVVGDSGWYLRRPGFWHGACGPAACWAGGAIGLIDYAKQQSRHDPHTLAHLGAMQATGWALRSYLDTAGAQIDADPGGVWAAQARALIVRHLVEQGCTDVLRRLARAYGPRPLAMESEISRRYQELDLYLRQCHAERDLEVLGRLTQEGQGEQCPAAG